MSLLIAHCAIIAHQPIFSNIESPTLEKSPKIQYYVVSTYMPIFQETVVYFFLFVGIYFQVFILFTYLLNRKSIQAETQESFERSNYPTATIVVPCFNEEKTVGKTKRVYNQ
jgi:cellulose synthase/poly-beta-1,6-N-acetylglucosamine synthase-like glycosyltransferase